MARLFNIQLEAIAFVRSVTGAKYAEAISLAQLYGFLQHLAELKSPLRLRRFSAATGLSRTTVRNHLRQLAIHGWIGEIRETKEGLFVEVLDMPWDQVPILETEPAGWVSDGPGGGSVADPGVGQWLTPFNNIYNNISKNTSTEDSEEKQAEEQPEQQPKPEPKAKASKPKEGPKIKKETQNEIVKEINRLQPPSWPKIQALSEARLAALARIWDGNGGATQFLADLPVVMRSVRSNRFWCFDCRNKGLDAFIGTSRKAARNHWQEHLERGLAMTSDDHGANSDKPDTLALHPSFFRPSPISGEMVPRIKFKDQQHRESEEAAAREFYKELLPAHAHN